MAGNDKLVFVEVERIAQGLVVSTRLLCLSCLRAEFPSFTDYWQGILLADGDVRWSIPRSPSLAISTYAFKVLNPMPDDDLVCNRCKVRATDTNKLSPWDDRGTVKADEFYSVSCRATFEVEVSGGVALADIQWPTFILSVRALGIINANHAENIAKAMMYSAINLNGRRSVPNLMLHIVATKI